MRRSLSELEEAEFKCHESEEALRKREAKYKELCWLLPQIVYEIDAKAAFTFTNHSGLVAFDYDMECLARGLKVSDLVVLEDRERLAREMGRVIQGTKISENEFTALRKDGSTFPILTYANPVQRLSQKSRTSRDRATTRAGELLVTLAPTPSQREREPTRSRF